MVTIVEIIGRPTHPLHHVYDAVDQNETYQQNPNYGELEDIWNGGVADFGDREAATAIQYQPDYYDYRDALVMAVQNHLGDPFIAYRLMNQQQLEAWQHGGDIGPVAVALTKQAANAFRKFPHNQGQHLRLVQLLVPAEAVIMRGKAEEMELVVDGNEISADTLTILESAMTTGHDGDAYFAGPRVDDAWDNARQPLSRHTIAYMKPADFIAVAEPGFDREKMHRVMGFMKQGIPFNTLPFLQFDQKGQVIAHEGRHRVRALHLAGVQQIPVVLTSTHTRWGDDRKGHSEGPSRYPLPTHLLPQTTGTPIPMPQSAVFPQPPVMTENTNILYHGAPIEVRQSILQHGLSTKFSVGMEGIYLSKKPGTPHENFDIWAVDTTGLEVEPDYTTDPEDPEDEWFVVWDDIEPQRLKLLV